MADLLMILFVNFVFKKGFQELFLLFHLLSLLEYLQSMEPEHICKTDGLNITRHFHEKQFEKDVSIELIA